MSQRIQSWGITAPVRCNPKDKIGLCPGGKPCPQCGEIACPCPPPGPPPPSLSGDVLTTCNKPSGNCVNKINVDVNKDHYCNETITNQRSL